MIVDQVSMEEYVLDVNRLIFLNNLKIKLHQVKVKNFRFYLNQQLFGAKTIYNKVLRLTCINIEKFEKKFACDPDYKRHICNSY